MKFNFFGFKMKDQYKITLCDITEYPHWKMTNHYIDFIQNINIKKTWSKIRYNVEKITLHTNQNVMHVEKVLQAIENGNNIHFYDGIQIAKDSFQSEFGLVIDISSLHIEIFRGFQMFEKQKQNPLGINISTHGYFPCKLIAKIPLREILQSDILKAVIKEDNYLEKKYLNSLKIPYL